MPIYSKRATDFSIFALGQARRPPSARHGKESAVVDFSYKNIVLFGNPSPFKFPQRLNLTDNAGNMPNWEPSIKGVVMFCVHSKFLFYSYVWFFHFLFHYKNATFRL